MKKDNSGLRHDTQPVVKVMPLAFHPWSRFSRGWAVPPRHRLLLGAFVMTVAGGRRPTMKVGAVAPSSSRRWRWPSRLCGRPQLVTMAHR